MKQRLALFLASVLVVVSVTVAARSNDAGGTAPGPAVVAAHAEYRFVGDRGEVDADGRRLVFEATVAGDVSGVMKWWFVDPAPAPRAEYEGGYTEYYRARWEIREGGDLLLAGESAGKTFYLEGEQGIWDGHGVVTEAHGDYEGLTGRHYYETGPVVDGEDPPTTMHGTAMIVIH